MIQYHWVFFQLQYSFKQEHVSSSGHFLQRQANLEVAITKFVSSFKNVFYNLFSTFLHMVVKFGHNEWVAFPERSFSVLVK